MVYVPAHLDEEALWTPVLDRLPDGWNRRPPTAAFRDFGTDWLDSERSPALQVPSALFPTEAHDYLLNPAHPKFDAAVQIDEPQPLELDPCSERRLE
jgi:RES domain-containing protein